MTFVMCARIEKQETKCIALVTFVLFLFFAYLLIIFIHKLADSFIIVGVLSIDERVSFQSFTCHSIIIRVSLSLKQQLKPYISDKLV